MGRASRGPSSLEISWPAVDSCQPGKAEISSFSVSIWCHSHVLVLQGPEPLRWGNQISEAFLSLCVVSGLRCAQVPKEDSHTHRPGAGR